MNMEKRLLSFLILLFLLLPRVAYGSDETSLAAYSDPARIWGGGVERIIEEAYRLCFHTRILGGKVMNLRMPFAQDNERDKLTEEEWGFLGGGKGNPVFLWERINESLNSEDFNSSAASSSQTMIAL
jgi:hypothetical protein